MGEKKFSLAFESGFYQRMEKVAKRRGFKNVHDYVYDLIRRSVFSSRIRGKSKIDSYLSKFASPTKETYKIVKEVGGKI